MKNLKVEVVEINNDIQKEISNKGEGKQKDI